MKKINYSKRADKIAKVCKEIRLELDLHGINQYVPARQKNFVKEYAKQKKMSPEFIWKILS